MSQYPCSTIAFTFHNLGETIRALNIVKSFLKLAFNITTFCIFMTAYTNFNFFCKDLHFFPCVATP